MSELPKPPKPASQSHDSFPALSDDDRKLMNNVLTAAMEASKEVKRVTKQHEAQQARFEKHDEQISAILEDIHELKESRSELQGLRGDIATLNSNLMSNLQDDADRERRFGDLKVEVERIGATAGAEAGKQAGRRGGIKMSALITGVAMLVWLALWIWAVANHKSPPELHIHVQNAAQASPTRTALK